MEVPRLIVIGALATCFAAGCQSVPKFAPPSHTLPAEAVTSAQTEAPTALSDAVVPMPVVNVPLVPAPVVPELVLPVSHVAPPDVPTKGATGSASVHHLPPTEPAPWELSLDEARQYALVNYKSIAVLGHVPNEVETQIGAALGVFDPEFGFSNVWAKLDRQVANRIFSFGTDSTTQYQQYFQPNDVNSVYLSQRLATGGRVEIGHSLDYLHLNPVDDFVLVNPAYFSAVNFGIEQPLFKGRGPEVALAPLNIARTNRRLSVHAFEAQVSDILRDVELAYWDVARELRDTRQRAEIVRQAGGTLERERERLKLGEGALPDVALAEVQYEAFAIDMAVAETRLKTSQRTLSQLLGIEYDDTRVIVPVTDPRSDWQAVNWEDAVATAQQRPELAAQQAAIEAAEWELGLAQNGMEPDVAVRANYAVTGLADRYDDSWQVLGDNKFNDWTVGMIYRHPLGRRTERAALARAEIALSRQRSRLFEIEHGVLHELREAYDQLVFRQKALEMHRRRSGAAGQQLEARRELYNQRRTTLDRQIDAEERFAAARLDENLALIEYQKALTRWRYAAGILFGETIAIEPENVPIVPEK